MVLLKQRPLVRPENAKRSRSCLSVRSDIVIEQARRSPARGSLVGGLARYHPPHATSRVLDIALTTRDQVYVGVANSLSGSIAAIHADVEPAYGSILLHYLDPNFIQYLIDRTSLRLE
jgi:hypothetical protein